ncbi:MAG TPA: valine--tRNA ligase [Tepidisphaeraceae bacterium]|jgi:valyl-tRNA synthetase|nr:valine--tRNA ligase [Tepidisphaeraceae bacterium]
MKSELAKTYDPAAVEAEAYRAWVEEGCFVADPAAKGKPYCIVLPPPNVTGALHLGHAINSTLQDILIRQHRMRGFNVLWVPGIDHAGIATQAVVERELKEKENQTRHDLGREALVARIWQWKEQFGNRILEQLKRIGASCDWTRTRFTLDENVARAVRETFFNLFKDGLVYRGKRLVNWDTFLQTSISDDEIYHETVKTHLWHIRYPIVGSDKHVTVATTRPETMLGDTAVAVHPDDPRWNWAIGKSVALPLTDRKIPIIADSILVNMEFGSGVVKVTPAHDPNDYAVWERHRGQADAIDIINILTADGRLNDAVPPAYAGMKRQAARDKVVADLEAAGALEKTEPYETQVGHSDRSKTPIEPYLSDQWFVKMAPLAEPALAAVREGQVQFHPERHAQQYLSWLGEKRDWPISRQLWWGHRIPVWTCADPAKAKNASEQDMQALFFHLDRDNRLAWQPKGGYPRATCPLRERLISLADEKADELAGPILSRLGFVQDPDVLDTWFSSALWPHSTLGWPEKTADLQTWYPNDVLLTGRDIITLWVARMVMMGVYNMGEIPFHHVAINPTILDGHGERMSKSKGNGVDPVDIIDGYGADALRFTLANMATETQDVRMPVKKDAKGRNTSDKFDFGRNFCNKLWNAARFALGNLEGATDDAPQAHGSAVGFLADRWIVSRFGQAVRDADAALASFRFDQYAKACYDFFWRDFCDWYLEAIKPTVKSSAETANVLAAMLDGTLRLLHPAIPFITETIWWRLNDVRPNRSLPDVLECPRSERLVKAAWPVGPAVDELAEKEFAFLQELIVTVRNLRNQYQVDVKRQVPISITGPASAIATVEANRQTIELLASCVVERAASGVAAPADAARAVVGDCEIFAAGLVDAEAEKKRIEKETEALRKAIAALEARLANESYISKAPPALVQQTRDELAKAKAALAKLN